MSDNLGKGDNIALFDLDGTLCDYDKAIITDYNKIKSNGDPEYESFSKKIQSNSALKERIRLIRNQPGWWTNLEKYKPGFDILNLAKDLGFSINILTKSPGSSPNAWTEKYKWIKRNLADYNVNVTISDDNGIVYGKILVDDYPEYIVSWLANRPRGLVIMPAHPWNEDFKHNNVIRYDGKNLGQVKNAMIIAKNKKSNEAVRYF
jgi:5'(3')-deoxyribonucleotidase